MSVAISNKTSLLAVLHAHKQQIVLFGVKKLGLFGSFARNTATASSDVDFLVEFEQGKKTFDNFMDLSFYLENITGRNVEIVTPQSLSKYIGHHILRENENVF